MADDANPVRIDGVHSSEQPESCIQIGDGPVVTKFLSLHGNVFIGRPPVEEERDSADVAF
jgi:hypothetical protein